MDFATVVGLGAGTVLLGIAFLLASPTPGIYADLNSVIIVMGGTTAAVLVSLPLARVLKFVNVAKNAFRQENRSAVVLISTLVKFAEIARRDGILALENATAEADDEFLVKGIQLAVDGTDPTVIKETMEAELEFTETRHEDGKKIFDLATKYAPAFGMIGTLIGLVAMLAGLDDPKSIGSGMAVALITTLYGAILANLVFGPLADKLDIRNQEEGLMKQIVISGVMSIQAGDNPRIVAQKLKIFLPPGEREEKEGAAA